jgi:hypothetical protein
MAPRHTRLPVSNIETVPQGWRGANGLEGNCNAYCWDC